MFKLFSEDRQRKSAVLQIVRKSVPSETRQQIPKCFRTVLVAVESEIGCTSPSAKLLLSLCPLKYRRINQLVSCLNCMHCDTCLSGITKYSTTASKKNPKNNKCLHVDTYPKPSMEQATPASTSPNESSQTVPHIPATLTSRRPSRGNSLPASLISATTNTCIGLQQQQQQQE